MEITQLNLSSEMQSELSSPALCCFHPFLPVSLFFLLYFLLYFSQCSGFQSSLHSEIKAVQKRINSLQTYCFKICRNRTPIILVIIGNWSRTLETSTGIPLTGGYAFSAICIFSFWLPLTFLAGGVFSLFIFTVILDPILSK